MALTENHVVDAVCQYLTANGWKVISRCGTQEKGIDIIASDSNGQLLHVEAKGATSSVVGSARHGTEFRDDQVGKHVSRAYFTASKCIGTGVRAAIALPQTMLHQKYVSQIEAALTMLDITVFWVADDLSVRVMGR